tara:strand:- start:104 stop:550 length:447 start_codon:yes stop_codon:yes gene_type:complete
MSKKISYRGTIPIGEQEKIRLKTNNGKTGYSISKFQILPTDPGTTNEELICQVFSTDQTGSIGTNVAFTDSDLLAVAFYTNNSNLAYTNNEDVIIFDNVKFNQDIFVTMTNAAGGTDPANYYIELETMPLSDIEATQLTLQSIRQVMS